MIPAFQFSLGQQVLQGLVTVGKYDGQHPCLTAGTTAGKVLIHSPHNRAENAQNEIMFLNINRKITSVVAGLLSPNLGHDVLMIGTQTSLMVYDVEENADLFFKEVHDGVNVIAFGNLISIEVPVCVVGGNCSIQAYDHEGSELFWTVTGDNVSALTFCDVNDDGVNELLCGTEDFEIRVFAHEDVLKEITETDVVIRVEPVYKSRFAYALLNGTVGVYDKLSRAWRVKSKNRVNCISCFDLDNDGIPELIAGWENGKVEVRNQNSGEVLYKDYFQAPIASLVAADYRLDGRNTLMCLTTEGDVRGWLPSSTGGDTSGSTHAAENKDGSSFRDLQEKKRELSLELSSYQEQMKQFKQGGKDSGGGSTTQQGVIPTDTKINVSLKSNKNQGTVELHLMTSNYSVIRAVVIFAEHLFDGEACMLHPIPPSNNVIVQISPSKDVQTTMNIKAMAGLSSNSVQYHVFEVNHIMPKFSMYHCIEASQMTKKPEGYCTFLLPERPNRIWTWLQRSFITIDDNMQMTRGQDPNTVLDVNFVSLRNGEPLCISMTNEQGGKLTIRTDDLEVAGEMIQDCCNYLQVESLESTAHFPDEMEKFKSVLMKVDEYNAVRLKLTAEMADSSNLVKALIVKAEDYRMLSDMGNLKKVFSNLQQTNSDLIAEYNKRANNHAQLLSQLKEVNMMIQKAAKVRMGTPKTRVVSSCRQAIKKNNIHELFQIIRTGHDSSQ